VKKGETHLPNIHTRYVTWVSRGKRHHGSAANDIDTPVDTTGQKDGEYQPWAASQISWNDNNGQETAYFAFWSFTGTADGSLVFTNNHPTVTIGDSNMQAIAWYIPGGTGGPGVLIDAFDVDLGNFVDDDFVAVTPDANLTSAANNDGFLPTTAAEDVNAFANIHNVPFDKWLSVSGPETIQNRDLKTVVNSYGIDFAFYLTPKTSKFDISRFPEEWTWVSYGVMVDGGGPTGRGPVPPWLPRYAQQYAAGLALKNLAQHLSPEFHNRAIELGNAQLNLAGKQLAGLKQKG
jgi:hypothetical protein